MNVVRSPLNDVTQNARSGHGAPPAKASEPRRDGSRTPKATSIDHCALSTQAHLVLFPAASDVAQGWGISGGLNGILSCPRWQRSRRGARLCSNSPILSSRWKVPEPGRRLGVLFLTACACGSAVPRDRHVEDVQACSAVLSLPRPRQCTAAKGSARNRPPASRTMMRSRWRQLSGF